VFELDVEPLLAVRSVEPRRAFQVSQVVRDLALVVERDCSAQNSVSHLRKAIEVAVPGPPARVAGSFDEYRGKGLENNEKSLAFRFVFQDNSRTLNDEEIERALRDAIAAVAQYSRVLDCGDSMDGLEDRTPGEWRGNYADQSGARGIAFRASRSEQA
jgi:phenylalanyl-tRNA synthetase beta chain